MTSAIGGWGGGPQKAGERNKISWFGTVKKEKGGQKIRKFCGHNIWKPPYHYFFLRAKLAIIICLRLNFCEWWQLEAREKWDHMLSRSLSSNLRFWCKFGDRHVGDNMHMNSRVIKVGGFKSEVKLGFWGHPEFELKFSIALVDRSL